MALPFTIEQFHGVFRDYNTSMWPAQWVLVAMALAAVVAALRPRPWSGVAVSAILGVLWAWIALAYHLAFISRISPPAYAFAALSMLPCPTTIFTIGMLCFAVPPTPRSPLIVPVLWCLVGAQAAFLLGVQPDLGLIASGAVGVALLATAGGQPWTLRS